MDPAKTLDMIEEDLDKILVKEKNLTDLIEALARLRLIEVKIAMKHRVG